MTFLNFAIFQFYSNVWTYTSMIKKGEKNESRDSREELKNELELQ